MSLPREIKGIIGEYEGKTFRIDKGSESTFTFESVKGDWDAPGNNIVTLPLELKAGYWHFMQGPTSYSLLETGDSDLAFVPTYTLLFYHQSFDVSTLPASMPLAAERGLPYAKREPEEIKAELFNGREVTLTLCSNEEVKLHIKLNDTQPKEHPQDPPITHSIDTPYGVKEGDIYSVIAFPIIVSQSLFVRVSDGKIHELLRQTLLEEAERKTGITLRLEGDSDLHIDEPDVKTFALLGLPSAYENDEKSIPFKQIIIDREGAMGVITEGEEPKYLSTLQPTEALQSLTTLSDQLSGGISLRSHISNPAIKAALKKLLDNGISIE